MNKKHNSKLPNTAVCSGETIPKYGYVSGSWDECGGHNWHYKNPGEHDKSFSQKLTPSGSYEIHQHDNEANEINLKLISGEHRGYVGGGKSTQVDGHVDINSESTYRAEASGDFGVASGNKYIRGSKNQAHILESSSAKTTYGSSAVTSVNQSGTERKEIENNKFSHVHGDEIKGIENNKIVMVQKDSAHYVGQNYDLYANQKGKIETGQSFEVKSGDTTEINSSKKITIESDTESEIVVGQSSIKSTPSEVTIHPAKLITPVLGTPESGNLINCINFPIGALSGLGSGVVAALSNPVGTPGSIVINGGTFSEIMMEEIIITSVNTFPPLSQTYSGKIFLLIVNGYTFVPVGASPPFSISGKNITWLSTIWSVNPGDSVVAIYYYT